MSRLEALTQQYLETRQALGYRLHREAVQLPKFARFVIANGQDHVTVLLAIEWAAQTPSGGVQQSARRIGWVRQLARFLHASEYEVCPHSLVVVDSYLRILACKNPCIEG